MKVLILSPYPGLLHPALEREGDSYIDCNDTPEMWPVGADFIVSFGYRHIIPDAIVQHHSGRIINIHISLLPWNRGADPNFWSWYDDTPKGVTIHQIDTGIDTGPILFQKPITKWHQDETLSSSWALLLREGRTLFECTWPRISSGRVTPHQPDFEGSSHKRSDKKHLMLLLPHKWDTYVREVVALGKRHRNTAAKGDSGFRSG